MVKSDECQSRQYLSNYTPIPGLGVVLFCFVFLRGRGGWVRSARILTFKSDHN